MTYKELADFIENKMSMSQVYQPLMIRMLVESEGMATIRQIAQSLLAQDESQVAYYEKRVKEMPLRVLKKHGIVTSEKELVTLATNKLTLEQKANIKMLCEKRLQEYIVKRGLSIWDHRMIETDPVSDNLRYRVLKESEGRCTLCGATKKERPLDVDHIKPRSKGGNNDYENLQVLCSKCNRTKGNKDDKDFRHDLSPESVDDCPFCYSAFKGKIVEEYETAFAILDGYAVTAGHHLIIPKRHAPDYFAMSANEKLDADALINILRKRLSESDKTITGFNVGVNCGESAGQTIFHAHIHLIPRRDGDHQNPRGGVRGVIPEKQNY